MTKLLLPTDEDRLDRREALRATDLSRRVVVQRLTLTERWTDFKTWCKAQWDYFGTDWAERGETCEPW
jgi:hypothetical protein